MSDAASPRPDGHARRRAGTRSQIVDAAVRLVARQGFSATSVEDIAAEAKVAKGSVYYNFESKQDILAAALAEGGQRLQDSLATARADLHGRAALDALTTALLSSMQAHPDFAKLMAAEVFRAERAWQETIGAVRGITIGMFEQVLEELRPGEDVSVLAAAMFGAVLLAGLEWLVVQPERSLADVRASIAPLTSGI